MTDGLYQMSGTGDEGLGCPTPRMKTVMKKKVLNFGNKPADQINAGEMDLMIARERLKIEKQIAERKRGIGSAKAEQYQDAIDSMEDALEFVNDPDGEEIAGIYDEQIRAGHFSNASAVAGIGDIGRRKAKRQEKRKQRREERKEKVKKIKAAVKNTTSNIKTKTGKFVKKAVQKAKKGLKAITKALTAPQRLLAKAIMEVTLPKAAPFFLYLFVNDQALISRLPAKARTKRKKAEKIADFIVNNLGMNRSHFMGIVRNGIMKKLGASPETIISRMVQQKKISGIGIIADVSAVIEIIQKIASLFKKEKPEDVSSEDAASEDDFEGLPESEQNALSSEVKKQSDQGGESGGDGETSEGSDAEDGDSNQKDSETGGRSVWNSLK